MIYFILAFLIVLADQASKYLVTLQYSMGGHLDIIPGILRITYVTNTGGAFSMFSDHTMVLAIVSAVVCILVIVLMITLRNSPMCKISLGFILGGAIGNLIDRFVMGYVVDMFEPLFIDFAVFNIADIFITVGALLFVISVIFFWPKKQTAAAEDEEIAAPETPKSRRAQRHANKYGPDIDEATIVIPTDEIKSAAEKLEAEPVVEDEPEVTVPMDETNVIPDITAIKKQPAAKPVKKEVSADLSALPDDILNDLLSMTAKISAVTAPVEISTAPVEIPDDLFDGMPDLTLDTASAAEPETPAVEEAPVVEEPAAVEEVPVVETPTSEEPAAAPVVVKKPVAVRVKKAAPKAKPAEDVNE